MVPQTEVSIFIAGIKTSTQLRLFAEHKPKVSLRTENFEL